MAGVFFPSTARSNGVHPALPMDKNDDKKIAEQLVNFEGRKIVCGGTTGDIVARFLKKEIVIHKESIKHDIPPLF